MGVRDVVQVDRRRPVNGVQILSRRIVNGRVLRIPREAGDADVRDGQRRPRRRASRSGACRGSDARGREGDKEREHIERQTDHH